MVFLLDFSQYCSNRGQYLGTWYQATLEKAKIMSETTLTPVSAEEIAEVIAELEQYRQRIIDDNLEMAKQVKLPKKLALAQLEKHPEIAKIDANLERLRSQQTTTSSTT